MSFTRQASATYQGEFARMKKRAFDEARAGFRESAGEDADLHEGRDVFFSGYDFGAEWLLVATLSPAEGRVQRSVLAWVEPCPGSPDEALARVAHALGCEFGRRWASDPSQPFFFAAQHEEWSEPCQAEVTETSAVLAPGLPAQIAYRYRFLEVDASDEAARWLEQLELEDLDPEIAALLND